MKKGRKEGVCFFQKKMDFFEIVIGLCLYGLCCDNTEKIKQLEKRIEILEEQKMIYEKKK